MNILTDYRQALQGALLIDLSARARWAFTGNDRVRFLNGQTTNDVAALAPGQSLPAAICTHKGRMQGFLNISATADALYVDAHGSLAGSLGPRIERYIIADDVVMEDVSAQWNLYHLIANSFPHELPEGSLAFQSKRFGHAGLDLWIPVASPSLRMGMILPEAVDILRIERGLPAWGQEMTEETLPPEANLDQFAISYKKGCYIGQETIAKIKSIGHSNKLLVRLVSVEPPVTPVEPPTWPTLPAELTDDGAPAGKMTSVALHPERNILIGLGIVPRALAVEGNLLACQGSAWKIELPTYD
jgi:folate-binding protein YgfZ